MDEKSVGGLVVVTSLHQKKIMGFCGHPKKLIIIILILILIVILINNIIFTIINN